MQCISVDSISSNLSHTFFQVQNNVHHLSGSATQENALNLVGNVIAAVIVKMGQMRKIVVSDSYAFILISCIITDLKPLSTIHPHSDNACFNASRF